MSIWKGRGRPERWPGSLRDAAICLAVELAWATALVLASLALALLAARLA